MCKQFSLVIGIFFLAYFQLNSQFVPVGSGSYTTVFPGVDSEARNGYPSGTPQISGNAIGKPVPTNDWWSALIKTDHVSNLFNYPLAMRTANGGLVVSYIIAPSGAGGSTQPMDDVLPITVGVTGLNATRCTVSDYSDWTVTMAWNDGSHDFYATAGIAMPFLYFTKKALDVAQVNVSLGTVVINNEMLVITNAKNGSDFAVYAPMGSIWVQNGSVYTSNLNGKNYWSMAFIPPSASNVTAVAVEYKKYAYVFPATTTVSWDFNETTSKVSSTFTVTTDVKEGTETNMLMGLLPHQWGHLASTSPVPSGYSYSSIRGEIKTLDANSFSVENTFYGILPTLPGLENYSPGYSPATLNEKVTQLENDGLATWTDSYNEGQMMNRLIQTARIADQMGNTVARDKMVATIKSRLENWLKADPGEVAFLFYYNDTWSALLGYPAGHMQDSNLNDHHFHWGYFIHAAAFVEQFNPGWASQWGEMVNLLIRDAASANRSDPKFPFLRSFSPYAGHAWANGFATFPFGNDQESSSESMQFNSSLIHWGTITGNKAIRDLGIYLYTTEQTAIEEYWFDIHQRTLKPEYNYSIVSRIWGNGYDNQTFWTGDIEAVYGIEMYPVHGGSLYLGQDTAYVKKLWDEITTNTGILTNEANVNLWHDVMWEYLSFINPQAAINLYNSYPERSLKFGVSDAQTYHWLHSMNAIGRVNTAITADYPISAVFTQNGKTIYVAHNYSANPITVSFSDGYKLQVPANKMATSKDIEVSGILSSDFSQAFPNGSINLSATITGISVTKVEFYDGNTLIGTLMDAPFTQKATNLELGIHRIYARIYSGDLFNVTNIIAVQVGSQVPYPGKAIEIPGTIDAGNYDKFEGGAGQGISYVDVSIANEGGYRPSEYVDASQGTSEGATVGWISAGEWLEYSVDVKTAGVYTLNFRYASGNASGGGPFHIELDDKKISADILMATTGKWDIWANKTITNLEMPAGRHILKLVFDNGEFNLGKMSFAYSAPLGYNPPLANAGTNVKVLLPATNGSLDGSLCSDPDNDPLSYSWDQIYGPSKIVFSDNTNVSPGISNLEYGIYQCRLTVSDGIYTSSSDVMVIVTLLTNLEPYVSITSPSDNASFFEGKSIMLSVNATDLDGIISLVEFFEGANKIGEVSASPFSITWTGGSIGEYIITAKATDDGGAASTSAPINVIITTAPSCEGGPANGDYTYRFTPDKNNPALTFIPGKNGVGSPTCILYYGTTTSGPFPGNNVKPNTPFPIAASEGSVIYFYYTYSYTGGERNTSAAMHVYEIGSCNATGVSRVLDEIITIYPNPVSDKIFITGLTGESIASVFNICGNLMQTVKLNKTENGINLNHFPKGMYFIKLQTDKNIVVKQFVIQ
jgi:endo-1,3(4)-beta-glucanase